MRKNALISCREEFFVAPTPASHRGYGPPTMPPAISVLASDFLARSCRFHSRYFRRHSVVHRPSRRQAAKNGGPRSRKGSQSSPPHESVHSPRISQWVSSVPSLPLGSLRPDSAWVNSCGRHTKTNPPHPRGGRRSVLPDFHLGQRIAGHQAKRVPCPAHHVRVSSLIAVCEGISRLD